MTSATGTAPAEAVSDRRGRVAAAISEACRRIAPLWPLERFVAVNPFLGFSDTPFGRTAAILDRVAGARMLAPRAFYLDAMTRGAIANDDLAQALAAAGSPLDPEAFRRALSTPRSAPARPRVLMVADVLDRLAKGDRRSSRTAFMTDEISKFCAAYFDKGQAVWRLPSRGLDLYAAWREAMAHDLNPEIMGVTGFRQNVAAAPARPLDAILHTVDALGIPDGALADYFHRALFDIGGWAAYARHLDADARPEGYLPELLAIRVVWGLALFEARRDPEFRAAWSAATRETKVVDDPAAAFDPDLCIDLIAHDAYERAFLRRWLPRLKLRQPAATPRPECQAAFCIDVRSEVFRRALESVAPGIETLGFAGFFGFPIEYVPIGNLTGGAQCPVLLKPPVIVCEAVDGVDDVEEQEILGMRRLRRRAGKAWKSFKLAAISSFAFVETIGLGYAVKLALDSLGLTRPVADPKRDGLDADVVARLGPRIAPRIFANRATGFAERAAVDMAERVLRAMSLTEGFAPLVLLAGHGSTSVNNPHAAGLDCGACGGHTGEANARVAAAILNAPHVRKGLRARGIDIPDDVWFLAALHDTTTDNAILFETGKAPPSHREAIAKLRRALDEAGALARRERAPRLGTAPARLAARSRDWSQVRPEWGLAGAAWFIAGPRALTRSLDLGGRAFLHSYEEALDPTGEILELILTAPMIVATWISLQYFGSTTNNRVFGAGDKTLHNVVGALGVIEGNSGDLRVGLPRQSVHDGERFAHEPVRLHVLLAASAPAIESVLDRRPDVRELVDNEWVRLFRADSEGAIWGRRARNVWQAA